MEFLRANGCDPVDETDWAYPIWRSKGTGRICGLDLDKDLDDFMICAICHELMIDPSGFGGITSPVATSVINFAS